MLHYEVELLDGPDQAHFHTGPLFKDKSVRHTIRHLFQRAIDMELQGIRARVSLCEEPPKLLDDRGFPTHDVVRM